MKYLHNVSVIWSYSAIKNIVYLYLMVVLVCAQLVTRASAQNASAPSAPAAGVAAHSVSSPIPNNAPSNAPSTANLPDSDVKEWLRSMHEAAMRRRSYIGTVVVSSQQGMSSAKIWHTCDGVLQMERIESLTGAPRSSFRRGDQLLTLHPDTKTARSEKRDALGAFPDLLKPGASQIPEFYAVKAQSPERMAGLDAQVVQLLPKDPLRFGYRIWTDKKSQLVLKLQTLDASGAVLEQAAFTEVQLDAPVKMEKLALMMAATEGYKIETVEIAKTTAAAEGWVLKTAVPGFKPMSCFKRAKLSSSVTASPTMQWIFSDGLATVSLFVEDYDKARHLHEGAASSGATHTLLKRMDSYWLTAVGEVPAGTLKQFASALERKK